MEPIQSNSLWRNREEWAGEEVQLSAKCEGEGQRSSKRHSLHDDSSGTLFARTGAPNLKKTRSQSGYWIHLKVTSLTWHCIIKNMTLGVLQPLQTGQEFLGAGVEGGCS